MCPVPKAVRDKPYSWDGYHWCVNNWGSKWDLEEGAVSTIIFPGKPDKKGRYAYSFETAWGAPKDWVINASKKFPELKFRLSYCAFEDDFLGYCMIKNGKVLKEEETDTIDESEEVRTVAVNAGVRDLYETEMQWQRERQQEEEWLAACRTEENAKQE